MNKERFAPGRADIAQRRTDTSESAEKKSPTVDMNPINARAASKDRPSALRWTLKALSFPASPFPSIRTRTRRGFALPDLSAFFRGQVIIVMLAGDVVILGDRMLYVTQPGTNVANGIAKLEFRHSEFFATTQHLRRVVHVDESRICEKGSRCAHVA